ncbi:hypothetical protein ACIQ8G_03705 [Streptomyces sp. NPDC094154]|uniref:hypothetical protein n=1 Tax=Streptomyces sp. NPDC094154 TaxID=3366059 RepID=UPI0038164BD5
MTQLALIGTSLEEFEALAAAVAAALPSALRPPDQFEIVTQGGRRAVDCDGFLWLREGEDVVRLVPLARGGVEVTRFRHGDEIERAVSLSA